MILVIFIVGIILGIVATLYIGISIPSDLNNYFIASLVSIIDSTLALLSRDEKSGSAILPAFFLLLGTLVYSFFIIYLGNRLGVDLFLLAVLPIGVHILINFSSLLKGGRGRSAEV